MHYLITGGAGFIGSHLADALLERGDHVTVIDDLSTGGIRNIAHLRDRPDFRYVVASVLERRLLAELVDEADGIFHLAAAVGVNLIIESPVRTIQTNVQCTEVLLEVAEKKKKKVLLTSTSEVYGKSTDVPFREDGDIVLGATTRGRWSYACSKAIDEFLAVAYWRERQLPTTVVRLFNTVGPRQTGQYGMVIPRFVQQALAGEPITVFGDGTQSRCFTHVSDSVRALVDLMRWEGGLGEVFNIGNQEEVTILRLAERVRAATASRSDIVLVPYSEAYESNFEDMPRRVPAIDKIHRAIGWRPRIALDGILESVIAFYRGSVLPLTTTLGNGNGAAAPVAGAAMAVPETR